MIIITAFCLQNLHNFSLAMALNVNALLNQIIFNYVACNYSSNVMEKLTSVADNVYDAHWYEFPNAQQKYFRLVIQRSQKKILLTGYGVITCSMETFLAVCLASKSVYLIYNFHKFEFHYSCSSQHFHISSYSADSVRCFQQIYRLKWNTNNVEWRKSGCFHEFTFMFIFYRSFIQNCE